MLDELPKTLDDVPLPSPTENAGKRIVIFGRSACPDCARVKKFLTENAIEYEYLDIDIDKNAQKWVASFSQTIPVLIMPDKSLMYSPSNSELFAKIYGDSINKKVTEVSEQVFDTIIIGAGPAGITATIYAVRKSLKVLLISKDIGGQAARSGEIDNYPGFTVISGADLATKFKEEVERFQGEGLWIKEGVEATNVEGEENNFTIKTNSGKYRSKTVIVASGRVPKMLGIPGEKEFFGKGVVTCATCDGPLYKGKDVAVIGGGNSALDAAHSLMSLARSVKIINLADELRGDEILLHNVSKANNVEVFNDSTAIKIAGKNFVENVEVEDTKTHERKILEVSGVFIEIGYTPSVDFIPQVAKDKQNQIIVDELGVTSVPGIWAAGDVNNLWGEQIVIAAGEGAKVALSVAEHIAKLPHQKTSNIHES